MVPEQDIKYLKVYCRDQMAICSKPLLRQTKNVHDALLVFRRFPEISIQILLVFMLLNNTISIVPREVIKPLLFSM